MAALLQSVLEKISIREPQVKENLAVVPLLLDNNEEEPDYLLLEEALKAGVLEIGEVSQEGSVNTVSIRNNAETPVLILDGEEILGAKQNRMVNATVLIPGKKGVEIPVSCVEQGRWRYRSPVFDKTGSFGYSTLRRQKAQQVSDSLRFSRGFASDQGAIWEEIDRKHERMGTHSPTGALHEIYESHENKMSSFVSGLEPLSGQCGIAVFINDRFTCLDLFDNPQTLRKLWAKLLKSYALEAAGARENKKGSREADVQQVLEAVKASDCIAYPSAGLGSDLRLRGRGITGAGLALEERILHLCVFGSGEEPYTGGMGSPGRRRRNMG